MATHQTSAPANGSHPLISFKNVTKLYGATAALSEVTFECRAGEIRAVLGENGAGKSTLMKLLSGVIAPSEGTIFVDGEAVRFKSPAQAKAMGIICMFQELSLVPDLTVRENILLGVGKLGFPAQNEVEIAKNFLNKIDGGHISMNRKVSELTLPERQQVEIAKALCRNPKLLILDEATSALNASVVAKVFDLIRSLKNQGTGILFISHRFHEVDELADTISVFRNGRHIETFEKGQLNYNEIIQLMIGQRLTELFPPRPSDHALEKTVLEIDNLSWGTSLHGISLKVHEGEILGLGGLDGQGQINVLQALFGLLKDQSGSLSMFGKLIKLANPKAAKSKDVGIAFVPEDRKTEGLVLDLSIQDNIDLARIGRPDNNREKTEALISRYIEELALKFTSLDQSVHTLSGGNQQKVSLIKWLSLSPRCLLLADPTRGIDVKTKTQIYTLMRNLASEGVAIILLSTDFEELVNLCDQVHIYYEGKVQNIFEGEDITPNNIIAASLNVHDQEVNHA